MEQLFEFEAYLLTEKRAPINTIRAYISDVKQYATYLEDNNKSSAKSCLADAQHFLSLLRKDYTLSARSMARKISSLKIFFNWAAQFYGWHNYTTDLLCPKIPRRLPTYLTPDQINQLFEVVKSPKNDAQLRNKVILYLLYVSGMRITELASLTTTQLYNNCLTVLGKGGKERLIPLPDFMIDLLEDYYRTAHKNFITKYGSTTYMFPICYAGVIKPISRQNCWVIIKNICRKTKIDKEIWPHQLRHSLATHLLKNGADLRSLQLLLGHENIATVEIYTHLDTSHLRGVYDKKHPRS